MTLLIALFLAVSAHADTVPNPIVVGNARFTVISPEVIRTEYQDSAKFIDEPSLFAINRDTSFKDFTLTRNSGSQGDTITIETSKVTLTYRSDGKPFSSDNLTAEIRFSEGYEAQWHFGDQNSNNLGGTRNSLDYLDPDSDKVSDGLLARDGWYWLDDSSRALLDAHGWVKARPAKTSATSAIDGYLFGYGDDYKGALRALTQVGGDVPMPRREVFGSWYSRWWAYSSDDYRQIVREYHEHDFPLDILVMDMDWHKDGWTGISWNRELLPDAEKLLGELHAQRIGVTLNEHPDAGLGPDEDTYAKFMADMGQDSSKGDTLQYDAGDKKYIQTLFEDTHTPLEKEGVDFWWVDWMGDDKRPFNYLAWINELYFRHTQEAGLRGQSFSRWADWGDHRHPIHFSGDTWITWETLAYEVPFTAEAGNVGAFYWSHDIGGFQGFPNGELLARWTQFGATSAALRLHATKFFMLDKRPWGYDQDIEDSMRVSFHLRAQLMPYVYSSAWEAHRESLPLNRPLYLDDPNEDNAYKNPQEYYFGDAFLAAPITSSGDGDGHVASQNVWFPQGRWFDWFTGQEYRGGSTADVEADISRFPLFARGGTPILMQPYNERPTSEPLHDVIVRVYPGTDGVPGKATLYEDDGSSKGYLHGEFRETDVVYQKSGNQVSIHIAPAHGTFANALTERRFTIELAQVGRASSVIVDGTPASSLDAGYPEYEDATRTERITLSPRNAVQATDVVVKF